MNIVVALIEGRESVVLVEALLVVLGTRAIVVQKGAEMSIDRLESMARLVSEVTVVHLAEGIVLMWIGIGIEVILPLEETCIVIIVVKVAISSVIVLR